MACLISSLLQGERSFVIFYGSSGKSQKQVEIKKISFRICFPECTMSKAVRRFEHLIKLDHGSLRSNMWLTI